MGRIGFFICDITHLLLKVHEKHIRGIHFELANSTEWNIDVHLRAVIAAKYAEMTGSTMCINAGSKAYGR